MNIIAKNVYTIAKAIGGKDAGMVANAKIKAATEKVNLSVIMEDTFGSLKEAGHAKNNGHAIYLRAKGFAKSIAYVPLNALKAIGKKIPVIKKMIGNYDTATASINSANIAS